MRDVSMLAAGLSISAAIVNLLMRNYMMALVMLGLTVLNIEMGVRRGR